MKFQINSSLFLKALKRAASVVAQNPIIPILENAVIRLTQQLLVIHTSNLANHLEITIPFECEKEGETSVEIRSLISYLSTLSNQTLNIRTKGNLMIIAHQSGEAKFPIVDSKEFPPFPEAENIEFMGWDADEAIASLKHLAETAQADDSFDKFVGIHMHDEYMVAMDKCSFQRYKVGLTVPAPCTISRKIIQSAMAAFEGIPDEQLQVGFAEKFTIFKADGIRVTCQNMDMQEAYPDYSVVLSGKYPYKLTTNRNDLIAKIKRVGLLANKASNLITFTVVDGELEITAINTELETEAKETCDCTTDLPEKFSIGFPSYHLLKQLSYQKQDEIELHFGEGRLPMNIELENSTTLVMSRA